MYPTSLHNPVGVYRTNITPEAYYSNNKSNMTLGFVLQLAIYYLLVGIGYGLLMLSLTAHDADGELLRGGLVIPKILVLLLYPALLWPVFIFGHIRGFIRYRL